MESDLSGNLASLHSYHFFKPGMGSHRMIPVQSGSILCFDLPPSSDDLFEDCPVVQAVLRSRVDCLESNLSEKRVLSTNFYCIPNISPAIATGIIRGESAVNGRGHRIGYTSLIGLEVKSPTKYIEADGTTAVTARASLRGMIEWVRSSVRAHILIAGADLLRHSARWVLDCRSKFFCHAS